MLVFWFQIHSQYPAFVLSSSHHCWFWYHLCADDFLPLMYVCLYQSAFPFVTVLSLTVIFSFTPWEIPLAFVSKLVWWCWVPLVFACLYSFVLFFQFLDRIWMWALLGKVFLFVGSSLSSLKYIVPLPLAYRFSAEKLADNFIRIPLYTICCF